MTSLIPIVVDRAGKDIDDPYAGRSQLRPQRLRQRQRRRLRRRIGAVGRIIGEREDRQEIDPGDRVRGAVGAARAMSTGANACASRNRPK